MKAIRKKSTKSTPLDAIISDLPDSLEGLFPATKDTDHRHFGLISMALLFLGHGLTDEAHDIVTPLSWPDDTHFGYGPSIYSQVSPSAKSYATYVHCLVHRREAFNVGEFGMIGFSNANYWSNAVLNSPGVDSLPHQDLWKEIGQLTRENDSIPGVKEWCQNHGFLQQSDDSTFFESRAVHELCATVLKGNNPELQDFAERVAETEVRVLLAHALQNAGYDCDVSTLLQRGDGSHAETSSIAKESEVMQPIDENAALSAARKVSSAHLNMFRTGGSVTIRKVLNSDGTLISAAAGIACRLLESPACRVVESSTLFLGTSSTNIHSQFIRRSRKTIIGIECPWHLSFTRRPACSASCGGRRIML